MKILAILIVEQVGEHGRREALVVELDGEAITDFVRLLRPGSPDLGATDKDAMAGDIVGG